ncbi:hypothetical protein EI77_00069 [Prosthecobacter fusiformis]|uniref:Uncharacterized protein n=1 Tax=Prosthecobacter fusiformis TaxID=48464 RepID=A0A4R7SNM5_9BACT|nr:hypothetical protein EI77_00069 [Prosthecobacter fusiformis]
MSPDEQYAKLICESSELGKMSWTNGLAFVFPRPKAAWINLQQLRKLSLIRSDEVPKPYEPSSESFGDWSCVMAQKFDDQLPIGSAW